MEALVLRLLAKDPAERPGSASETLAALESMDLKSTRSTAVEEPQVLDSLAGGVFVGRQREMGELKAALEEALSAHGRLVMLVGRQDPHRAGALHLCRAAAGPGALGALL